MTNIYIGDGLHFLSINPNTDVILLYVEGIRDARSFMSSLRAAATIKPVIVLKSRRHNLGSEAAHTNTAALKRAGAVRVGTFGQLFSATEILSSNQRSAGNLLGIITNGGGAGVLAADRAGDLHIRVSRPPVKSGPYDHLSIAPYPRNLIREGFLADGTPFTIRPIQSEDVECEQTFVRELSAQAKQFRFMVTVNELSPKMLARFTQIDSKNYLSKALRSCQVFWI